MRRPFNHQYALTVTHFKAKLSLDESSDQLDQYSQKNQINMRIGHIALKSFRVVFSTVSVVFNQTLVVLLSFISQRKPKWSCSKLR
eukprot:2637781-Amphidinium_carterae.1